MAVLFDDASSEYYNFAIAPITAVPFTMACWSYPDADANDFCMMQIQDASVSNQYFRMNLGSSGAPSAGDTVVSGFTSGSAVRHNSTANMTLNAWNHACSRWNALDDKASFLNGGNKGIQETLDTAPTGLDSISIGAEGDSPPGDYWSGRLFWPAVWDVALSDEEVAILAKGVPPWKVRPESLVFFTPLGSADGTPRDWISGTAATTGGTPVTAEGPHVQLDSGIIVPYNIAAGTNTTITIPLGPVY